MKPRTGLHALAALVLGSLLGGCNDDRPSPPKAEFSLPALATPRPGLDHVRLARWDDALVEGRTLYVRYTAEPGPCGLADRVEVSEEGDQVRVGLYVGVDPRLAADASPGVTVGCSRVGMLKTVRVDLPKPIEEGRTFTDAAEPGSRRPVLFR